MLQINSGKMFKNRPDERNHLRGILHTNLRISGKERIETTAGDILPVTNLRDPGTMVYEVTERFEKDPPIAKNLHSHGVDPYLKEIATIVSFALNVICTPDYQLTHRLISERPNLMGDAQPNQLVSRVFDKEVWCNHEEITHLTEFTEQLIGLDRRHHLAAMRAMRTYVTGVHRIADDYELAYTLLVAAVESLAQEFHGHQPEWEDYEKTKRDKIDEALAEADTKTVSKVRQAILDIEHTALTRRFRDFVLQYLQPPILQQGTNQEPMATPHAQIRRTIREAYNIRSRYLHTLSEMPNEITLPNQFEEITRAGVKTLLTFEGLTRLARYVITKFVILGPKIEKEDYDYHLERFRVVRANVDHIPTRNSAQ